MLIQWKQEYLITIEENEFKANKIIQTTLGKKR